MSSDRTDGGTVRETIERHVRAIAPTVYEGMAQSLILANRRAEGLSHPKYPHNLPMQARMELREYLEGVELDGGWLLAGNSRLMAELTLELPQENLVMRFLKERRRTYPGGVPVAGSNLARSNEWTNQSLDLTVPGHDVTVIEDDPINLLLLWDFLDVQSHDGFGLRVVHTLKPGSYGHAVPIDLIINLDATGFTASRLKFQGSGDSEEFFVDLTEEKVEDDAS
ncbi:MAG: hypothetical protein ACRC0L_07865 [Angustibacter sp.]